MTALLIEEHSVTAPLQRVSLARGDGAYTERWLQGLLYRHPGLVPLDLVEPGTGLMVPLCEELNLPHGARTNRLDILAVTRTGRLVLIECKLWRNPQARREVVAQLLEYAALLRGWTYGDLTAQLVQNAHRTGPNPIFDQARGVWPDLDEAVFVDGVARSLDTGDFHLVIAGDGIRSDLHAVADHLNIARLGRARLSLLEIQLWRDSGGRTLVVPSMQLRTEVIQRRILLHNDMPVEVIEDEGPSSAANGDMGDPARRARADENRAFWQRFIDGARFDHPDQPAPRHGGNNWVKVPLPDPVGWVTAYRTGGVVGFSVSLRGEDGEALFRSLQSEADVLRTEGLSLGFRDRGEDPFHGMVNVDRDRGSFGSDGEMLEWLQTMANRFVTLLRPRISSWRRASA
jgi:hypothetical protein